MQRGQQIIQVPKTEASVVDSEEMQPQYILTSADGNEVILGDGQTIDATQLGNLVQQGATVQEVQVVEDGQEVTYAYTTTDNNEILAIGGGQGEIAGETVEMVDDGTVTTVAISGGDLNDSKVDDSFKYYDNIRGKINNHVLKDLVAKYDADNPGLTKNDRLQQWTILAQDYCQLTGQQKSRTSLMKKWTSARYYNEHTTGKTWYDGEVGKGRSTSNLLKSDKLIPKKHFKNYDLIRLESIKLERDAQKVFHENAVIEGEKLKKEAEILDVQLETMRLELAMRRAEAAKKGIVIQTDVEEMDIEFVEGQKTT